MVTIFKHFVMNGFFLVTSIYRHLERSSSPVMLLLLLLYFTLTSDINKAANSEKELRHLYRIYRPKPPCNTVIQRITTLQRPTRRTDHTDSVLLIRVQTNQRYGLYCSPLFTKLNWQLASSPTGRHYIEHNGKNRHHEAFLSDLPKQYTKNFSRTACPPRLRHAHPVSPM